MREVKNFALAQVCDSTNLNPATARLLGLIHIACRYHFLALAGSSMKNYSYELRHDIVETINEDHALACWKTKLSAALYNVQETCYALKTKAKPCWGTVPSLLKNHVMAEEDFREVATRSNGELSDRSVSAGFMAKLAIIQATLMIMMSWWDFYRLSTCAWTMLRLDAMSLLAKFVPAMELWIIHINITRWLMMWRSS